MDPTPARIRAHVTKIVKGVYAEGQLDESDLTFRDLNKLIDSFVRIITGLFHQRIAYPEEKPEQHKNRQKTEECRKEEAEELKMEWVVGAPGGACADKAREKGAAEDAAKDAGTGENRAAEQGKNAGCAEEKAPAAGAENGAKNPEKRA